MTKLKRSIGQLERANETEALKEEQIRLAYVQHFPGDVKYISLFVQKAENQKAIELQKRIMERIREAFMNNEVEDIKFTLCKADFFGPKEEKMETVEPTADTDDFFI
jgi:RAB protein geranylgeranyltransferase component A